MQSTTFKLADNITLVFIPQKIMIAHTCVLINVGSTDDYEGKEGISHLLEHMIFRQTKNKSNKQIYAQLEDVGGDINAYTSKEYTCIHASFLKQYLTKAWGLFSDLLHEVEFSSQNLDIEKRIILEELKLCRDTSEELIIDEFEELFFQGHPLSNLILGNEKSLQDISIQDISKFYEQYYGKNEIVIGVVGDYTESRVLGLANKFFVKTKRNSNTKKNAQLHQVPKHKIVRKNIGQSHYVVGFPTYSALDEKRFSVHFINFMLSDVGMGSILNMRIREKYGFVYQIESSYIPYLDEGLFYIYFVSDPKKVRTINSLLNRELEKISNGISETTLKKTKQQLKGQLALAEENKLSTLISDCKSILFLQRTFTTEDVFDIIDYITLDDIRQTAIQCFDENKKNILQYLPN